MSKPVVVIEEIDTDYISISVHGNLCANTVSVVVDRIEAIREMGFRRFAVDVRRAVADDETGTAFLSGLAARAEGRAGRLQVIT